MHFSYLFAAAAGVLLAESALALDRVNFTIGTQNLSATDLVNFFPANQDFVQNLGCTSLCTNISSIFKACAPTDNACICTIDNGNALFACESCLYNNTIKANVAVPNPLLGSQPALTAYTTGCAGVNITLPALKLTIPAGWEGPESNKLGLAATVAAVAIGALLGGTSLYIMATIS